MKIIGVLALLLTVLSGVSACTSKPVDQGVQTQSSSGGGGGGGSSGGGGSGGGGGGRY